MNQNTLTSEIGLRPNECYQEEMFNISEKNETTIPWKFFSWTKLVIVLHCTEQTSAYKK